jgi:hypothetical protein
LWREIINFFLSREACCQLKTGKRGPICSIICPPLPTNLLIPLVKKKRGQYMPECHAIYTLKPMKTRLNFVRFWGSACSGLSIHTINFFSLESSIRIWQHDFFFFFQRVLVVQQCTDHRSELARARKFIHCKILAQQTTRYNRAGAGVNFLLMGNWDCYPIKGKTKEHL